MNESRSIFFEMNRRVRDKWRGGGKEVGNIYIYMYKCIFIRFVDRIVDVAFTRYR